MLFMFHNDAAFSYETLRAASYIPYDGADLGELMSTAARIVEGDLESWHREWLATADRLRTAADDARAGGHRESARCAYLRASNYYRTAEFFLRDDPDHDPRMLTTWRSGAECFAQAAELAGPAWQRVTLPYEGTTLDGWFFASDAPGRRPTLLAYGGFDSTLEEMYFAAAAPAIRRGWNCMIAEGPGQGAALREQGLRFRPDWEAVATPAMDHLTDRPDVDADRIAIIGMSLGGYLAPRAAAFEPRIAACVAFDGIYSASGPLVAIANTFTGGSGEPVTGLAEALRRRTELPTGARWMLENLVWTFGAEDAAALLEKVERFDLTGVAERIQCPTLVLDAECDHFLPGQPQRLHDALTGTKRFVRGTADEGAEEHCHAGALAMTHQRIFDWLDETLTGSAK